MKILKYFTPKKTLLVSFCLFFLSVVILPTLHLFNKCQSVAIWNSCDIWELGVIRPLGIVAVAIVVAIAPFCFRKLITYSLWMRVTFFWLLIIFILILVTPTIPQGGAMMDLLSEPARDESVFFVAIPYIFISWLIALWGYVKKSR